LQIFETALGKIGILICYDSEFPLLARAMSEADLILVPSCTEAMTGYSRVRIGAMARALENQCVTVMSSTVGFCDWSYAVDENTGTGGVFGPPDTGFPATGVMAEGSLNQPGWTYAEVDRDRIAHVRADGVVLNRKHWDDQHGRDVIAATRELG
jgi:predicted amidohydrolase